MLRSDVLIDTWDDTEWTWTPLRCGPIASTPMTDDYSFLIVVAALCAVSLLTAIVAGVCVLVKRRKQRQYVSV